MFRRIWQGWALRRESGVQALAMAYKVWYHAGEFNPGDDTMKLTIIRVIAVLVIVAAVGLYVFGLINGDKPTDNLLRSVIIALSGVSALMKTIPRRIKLSSYADAYSKELGGAFAEDTKKRERLLEAIRLYDEDKHDAALLLLGELKLDARTRDEHYAVGLFTALCRAALGLHEAAIEAYEETAQKGAVSSQLYSNLGAQYGALQNVEKALEAYEKAIELAPENPLPHSNIANMVLNYGAYDMAAAASKRALELNPQLYQAASAVAMASAALGNTAEQEKYFNLAVAAGQDAKLLRNACEHYAMRAQAEAESEE